eukprot:s1078_g17.t1
MNDNLAAWVKKLGGTPAMVRALKPGGQSNFGRAAELARAAAQLEQLAQVADNTDHSIVRVEIAEGRRHQGVLFTCSACTKTWRKMGTLQHDVQTNALGSCSDRDKRLRGSSNRQFWWKASADLTTKLAKVWKLSAKERRSFTLKGEELRNKMGRLGGLHAGDYKRRRKAAGLNLKGRIRAKGLLHFQREKMVREGVEPNPGPSSCSWHGVTLNCGSGAANWAVVDEICDGKLRPDVLCLQETFFTPSSLAAASRKLAFKGFRLWATPPGNSVSGQFRGGVAMIVKLSLNATLVSSFSDPSGQVVVGQVAQTLIVSVWRSEREGIDQTPILFHLGEILTQAASLRQTVVLAGDWNWTPEENLFLRSGEFQLVAMNDADGYLPSRWKGYRAIDYALLSNGLDGSAISFLAQVFGDHKAFHFKVSGSVSRGATFVTASTTRFQKPVGCSLEDWHAAVAEAWDISETLVGSVDSDECQVDAEWRAFCARLEQALRLASCKVGQQIHQGLRQKGSAPIMPRAEDDRLCGSSHGSFRQRSMRKLLGRVRECNRQFAKTGRRDSKLVAAVTRTWPSQFPWSGWFPAEEVLEQELRNIVNETAKFRIAEWKTKMCQRGRYATNWLKGRVNLGVPEILSVHGQVAASVKDGFHELAGFWKQIWDRDDAIPRLSELQTLCDNQAWREPFPDGDGWFPSAAQLMVRAQDSKDTAPGCDGWTGQEVAKQLATYSTGAHPKEQSAGPVKPKDLRPIAVLSVWYRVFLTAVSRQEAVQQWILRIAPAACHGGLRGRSVATALSQLLPELEKGSPALALDYRKCFDLTHPALVLGHMKLHRWPPGLISLFEHVWLQQKRWLELGHLTDATPHLVSSSLPQGDPFSPLGLLLVLNDATQEVAALGVSQSVFLDDRVLVAPTVRQLLQARRLWSRWSTRLGLQENLDKVVALAQNCRQRWALEKQGFKISQISSEIRILGIDYVSSGKDGGCTSHSRVSAALKLADKLCSAPIPVDVKRDLFRTRVVPLASWGWWLHDFPQKLTNKLFASFRRVACVHGMCSRDLRVLLEGHRQCPWFMSLAGSMVSFLQAKQAGLPVAGCWASRIHRALNDLGWSLGNNGLWSHPQEGIMRLHQTNKETILHQLRASWRRVRWNAFLHKKRRDSRQFLAEQFPFDAIRYKRASMDFASGDGHDRAVLTGAALSNCVYQVMLDGVTHPGCVFCGNEEAYPSWHHLCWFCPRFAATRPSDFSNFDLLQLRLGWRACSTSKSLAHMAHVRSVVLAASRRHEDVIEIEDQE